jgi:hypothetical protein
MPQTPWLWVRLSIRLETNVCSSGSLMDPVRRCLAVSRYPVQGVYHLFNILIILKFICGLEQGVLPNSKNVTQT